MDKLKERRYLTDVCQSALRLPILFVIVMECLASLAVRWWMNVVATVVIPALLSYSTECEVENYYSFMVTEWEKHICKNCPDYF